MATIIRDPLVDDHILELDVQTVEQCTEVRQRYEEGNLILLRGARFDLDYAFLNSVNFDVDGPPDFLRKMKKYGSDKIATLDASSTIPLDQFVFQQVFGSDSGKLAHYKEQVKLGNAQSDALYARIFPRYVPTRAMHSWRFTSTKFENLHWDNFSIPEIFQQVRIFSNIAAGPRLWRTSHRIGAYAASVYDQYKLGAFADKFADDLNRHVNTVALGGMKTPCLDRLPKHHIAFDQGDVWLCETRIISHQIYHGERAFAAMYFSDVEAMDRPELAFDAMIGRLHRDHTANRPAEPALAVSQ